MTRRQSARRSRIGRSGAVLGLAAVVFVLMVTWLRDNIERQSELRKLQASVDQLAGQDSQPQWPDGFVSTPRATELQGAPSEQMVVLAYQAVPRRLVLLPDGCAVAVQVGSQIQARWMTRGQLARQLHRQGLSLAAGDTQTPQTTQPSD